MRLIIVESGTSGLVTHAATDGSDQTVVIAQLDGETPLELASRVVRRVLVIERANLLIARTIVLLSASYDVGTIEARLLVVRALVTHSASAQEERVELILSAGEESRKELESGLPALIEALLGGPGTSAMTVGVKLAGEEITGPFRASSGQKPRDTARA